MVDTDALLASYFPNVERLMAQKPKPITTPKQTEQQKLGEFWLGVKAQALSRGDSDCPICYNPFNIKKTVLLSCSHVFHHSCIASFEKFER